MTAEGNSRAVVHGLAEIIRQTAKGGSTLFRLIGEKAKS
jgi:hypothetical protein